MKYIVILLLSVLSLACRPLIPSREVRDLRKLEKILARNPQYAKSTKEVKDTIRIPETKIETIVVTKRTQEDQQTIDSLLTLLVTQVDSAHMLVVHRYVSNLGQSLPDTSIYFAKDSITFNIKRLKTGYVFTYSQPSREIIHTKSVTTINPPDIIKDSWWRYYQTYIAILLILLLIALFFLKR